MASASPNLLTRGGVASNLLTSVTRIRFNLDPVCEIGFLLAQDSNLSLLKLCSCRRGLCPEHPTGFQPPFFFCFGLCPTLMQLHPNNGYGGSITKLNLRFARGYYITIKICMRICKLHVDLWLKPFWKQLVWLKPFMAQTFYGSKHLLLTHFSGSNNLRLKPFYRFMSPGPIRESKPPTLTLHQPSWCMTKTFAAFRKTQGGGTEYKANSTFATFREAVLNVYRAKVRHPTPAQPPQSAAPTIPILST